MATACFFGFPAWISVRIFSEISSLLFPGFNGMFHPFHSWSSVVPVTRIVVPVDDPVAIVVSMMLTDCLGRAEKAQSGNTAIPSMKPDCC